MLTNEFYDLLDSELTQIIVRHNRKSKVFSKLDSTGKKSYAFLLWFLKTYLPLEEENKIERFITEGPDDYSCDIIFENLNQEKERIFYVVQAKWFAKSNISNTNEMAKEVRACLTDFRTILGGGKISASNPNFKDRYDEFLRHKRRNGKITFIYLALCKRTDNLSHYTDNFTTGLISFELFDVQRLKKDYIEINYKGIKTHNPIETPYEPKEEIDLTIEQKNYIQIAAPSPTKAFIFLVKPFLIYSLFEKYGLALFYKNIRNPLHKSFYNEGIIDTIEKNPQNFWYFNNGITAITDNISAFHSDSETIKIKGIQIINGAQTVYSIYKAYKNANQRNREQMDANVLISFRILRSSGQDFDLNVTRYTNSQNQINERDFHANDDVQKRLQDDFLKHTNIWYETRRGEFVNRRPKTVTIIPNEKFAQAYLGCFLDEPLLAKSFRRDIFITSQRKPSGLYEKIFHDKTTFADMLFSLELYKFIDDKRKNLAKEIKRINRKSNRDLTKPEKNSLSYDFLQYASYEVAALMKNLLFQINSNNVRGMQGIVLDSLRTKRSKLIESYYTAVIESIREFLRRKERREKSFVASVYFKAKPTYPELKAHVLKKLFAKSFQKKLKIQPLITIP